MNANIQIAALWEVMMGCSTALYKYTQIQTCENLVISREWNCWEYLRLHS